MSERKKNELIESGLTVERGIRAMLTQEELVTQGKLLAQLQVDLNDMLDAKAMEAKRTNEELVKIKERMKFLATVINNGYEIVQRQCKVYYDFDRNAALTLDPTTADVLDERAMTGEERQMNLLGDLPGAAQG